MQPVQPYSSSNFWALPPLPVRKSQGSEVQGFVVTQDEAILPLTQSKDPEMIKAVDSIVELQLKVVHLENQVYKLDRKINHVLPKDQQSL